MFSEYVWIIYLFLVLMRVHFSDKPASLHMCDYVGIAQFPPPTPHWLKTVFL